MSVIDEAHRRVLSARRPPRGDGSDAADGWCWRREAAALAVLVVVVAALFVTAPLAGQYWWSDAPRHALNGAFVRDLVTAMPLDHPRQWAVDYYFQYPALTILFYPPLFPAAEAVVFAVAGVSPWSAQLTVALFSLLAGWAAYGLGRQWLDRGVALGAAVLFLGLPETALWGRQVMLEVPECALLLATLWAFVVYLRRRRPGFLYAAAALFAATLYTKQTALFVAPVMLLLLLTERGGSALRDRHVWIAAGCLLLTLLPLAWMTLAFGGTNLDSVAGVQDAAVSRASLANWSWYLGRLPSQVGWPVALLAGAWAMLAGIGRRWRLPRAGQLLLVAWFATGYLFFSLISLKEARFTVVILFPVALAVATLVQRAAPRRWAGACMLALAAAVLGHTLATRPVPVIDGYAQAADWIASRSPERSVVLFSGLRDGSFVFNLRSHEERDDLSVIRADKLLLEVAVRRGLGVRERSVSEAELRDSFARLGVRYVVADPDFWSDLENMQLLRRVLESPPFARVATIPVHASVPYAEREIRIYRNDGPVAAEPESFTMQLKMIGETIRASGR